MYFLWLAAVYILIGLAATSVPAFAGYAPPPLLECSSTTNGDYNTLEIDDGGSPGNPGVIVIGSIARFRADGIHLDPLAQFDCFEAQEDTGPEGGCATTLVFSDHLVDQSVTIVLHNNSDTSAALTFDRSQLVSGAQLSISFSVSTVAQENSLQCQVVATGTEFDTLRNFLFR